MEGAGRGTLFLFVGDGNQIYQANLTLEMPGATVTRTVARTQEEMAQKFATCTFDGQRLQLKSDGSFEDTDSNESLKLSWTANVDIPVVDRRKPRS
jgi:hypothetical protein